ncbi:unnamed protein product [Microthlaspi erraticum]|uniref:Reverse transcriptase domain-containing protein n=1 Tax=Microthlaspi erraticum TaxID=1685480 RepID=A0A6D2I000_9BRAS|nr:unnamed protein product [Microthlaspi erraticum]
MSNSLWTETFPSSRCYYLDFEGSDHRPLLSILETHLKKKKGIFRYDRNMKDNPEITTIVEKAWNLSLEASVEQRIGSCRKSISKWNLEHHSNAQKEIQEEKRKLELAMSSPTEDQALIATINNNLSSAYQKEEAYWHQRSRTLWLALGDRNSGYFHAATRGRRTINKLAIIEDSNGISVYKSLIAEPSPSEIKAALFSINPDKAPGPDGFSAGFFQTNWSVMGPKITEEVKEIFEASIIPSSLNRTHVRLIPKTPSPKALTE